MRLNDLLVEMAGKKLTDARKKQLASARANAKELNVPYERPSRRKERSDKGSKRGSSTNSMAEKEAQFRKDFANFAGFEGDGEHYMFINEPSYQPRELDKKMFNSSTLRGVFYTGLYDNVASTNEPIFKFIVEIFKLIEKETNEKEIAAKMISKIESFDSVKYQIHPLFIDAIVIIGKCIKNEFASRAYPTYDDKTRYLAFFKKLIPIFKKYKMPNLEVNTVKYRVPDTPEQIAARKKWEEEQEISRLRAK